MVNISKQKLMTFTPLETMSLYIAAVIHDYEHPGFNNPYQIATQSEISLKYNDQSVLEMFHIYRALQVLEQKEFDILEDFDGIQK
jgi:hypothetical protein